MTSTIKHLSELTKEEYRVSYDMAVILYHTHPNALDEDKASTTSDMNVIGQTPLRPMHPNLFYQLSQVRGFNNLNGNRYKDYYNNYVINSGDVEEVGV